MASMTTVTGTLYIDLENLNPAANCVLCLWPTYFDTANGPPDPVKFTLDGSGNVPGGSQVEDMANWADQTGGYRAQLLDPTGTMQYWQDGPWKITGASFTVPNKSQIDALN